MCWVTEARILPIIGDISLPPLLMTLVVVVIDSNVVPSSVHADVPRFKVAHSFLLNPGLSTFPQDRTLQALATHPTQGSLIIVVPVGQALRSWHLSFSIMKEDGFSLQADCALVGAD